MTKYFAALLMFFVVWPSLAADINGYTAQYECRAGGAYCNVDVASLGKRTCDQTIKPSTPWSSINWSNSTICIEAGDHTSKGKLTIPSSASGKPGNYKVLRYYRADDSDDSPWKQSSANQAQVRSLVVDGADYWVVHRLSFPSIDIGGSRIFLATGTENDIIINRVLVEGMREGFANSYTGIKTKCCESERLTIQNSVVRNSWGMLDSEPMGVNPTDGTNIRVVNNELYNWSAHPLQVGRNSTPLMPGLVVENNDIYTTAWLHLPDGRARSKAPFSHKARGTQANPTRIIHNRVWGGRVHTTEYCCINGGGGFALYIGGSDAQIQEWILVQNNIFMESQLGVALLNNTAHNISFIGNVFHGMRNFLSTSSSHALRSSPQMANSEVYLNSFIDNQQYGFSFQGDVAMDVRCNAFMSGGAREGSMPGSSTQAIRNAFYGTPSWSFNGADKIIDEDISLAAGNLCTTLGCLATTDTRGKAIGDIVRTSTTPATSCTTVNDQDCFLYKVISVGTAGQVRAIRGPYAFYRKLQTKPEIYVIPYAKPYVDPNNLASSAPEAYVCPSDYAARRGVGVE